MGSYLWELLIQKSLYQPVISEYEESLTSAHPLFSGETIWDALLTSTSMFEAA